jgi:hypothetical protein
MTTEQKPAPKKAEAPKPAKKSRPSGLAPNIVFYCKDCEEIGPASRVGSRYVYTCDICGTKNVAFGTTRSIRSFFHLDDPKRQAKKELRRQKKAEKAAAIKAEKEAKKAGTKAAPKAAAKPAPKSPPKSDSTK